MTDWLADTARKTVNEIEGYVLLEGERSEARARAEAFVSQMPWLTRAQSEEVERLYVTDRMDEFRAYLRRIGTRGTELRGEYEARYLRLRRRLVGAFAVTVAGGFAAVLLIAGSGGWDVLHG
jgi:hypothetical protein